jgi:hypothetical protein
MDLSDYLSANAQGAAVNPLSGLTPDEENALRARLGMSVGQPAEIQVPALTPADRMRQGLPGLPTQGEMAPIPVEPVPIQPPPPAGMSHTNGVEDPMPAAPAPAAPNGAPELPTAIPVREPAAGPIAIGAPPHASTGGKELRSVEAAQQDVVRQQIEAQKAAEQAATAAAQKRQAELEAFRSETQAAQQREQEAMQGLVDRVDKAQQALAKPEAQIDRDRWWNSRSTGQKISSWIGMALGAIGAGFQGFGGVQNPTNQAVDAINQHVKQDIELQIRNQESSRDAKKAQLSGAMTAMQIARNTMSDSQAQRLFAHSLGMDAAASQADIDASGSRQQQIQANGAQLSADLRAKAYELRQQAIAREHSAWVQNQSLSLQAKTLGAQMADRAAEREKDLALAGMKSSQMNPEQQKLMLEVEGRSRTIKDRLSDIRNLIKTGGTYDVTGAHNAKLEAALNDVATDYAKMLDPASIARPTEVEQAKKSLFDVGPWIRDSTASEQLNAFEKALEQRRLEAYRVRGIQPPPDSSQNAVVQRLGAVPR